MQADETSRLAHATNLRAALCSIRKTQREALLKKITFVYSNSNEMSLIRRNSHILNFSVPVRECIKTYVNSRPKINDKDKHK